MQVQQLSGLCCCTDALVIGWWVDGLIGCQMREAQDRVNALASLDYSLGIVFNEHGQYCSSYPLDILVFEQEITGPFRPRASAKPKPNAAAAATAPPTASAAAGVTGTGTAQPVNGTAAASGGAESSAASKKGLCRCYPLAGRLQPLTPVCVWCVYVPGLK